MRTRRAMLLLTAAGLTLTPAGRSSLARAEEGGPADTPDAGAAVPAGDAELLQEIEAAGAGAPEQPASAPESTPPAVVPPRGAAGSFSNVFNPAMSANGLLLGSLSAPARPPRQLDGGLELQEVEVQLLSNVDPYFSANLIFTLPRDGSPGIEEGYLVAVPQLAGVSFRAGKIKAPFGRENVLHTHAQPFVDKSLVGTAVFGEEGLGGVGVEAASLLPTPWYSLATCTAFDGRDQTLLGSPAVGQLAGFAGLRNVFDLTDDATLEAGVSYAAGQSTDEQLGQALGAQLVFKWRPARDAASSSLLVALEGLAARQPEPGSATTAVPAPHEPAGGYGYVQGQLAQRWYVGGRYEYLADRRVPSLETTRESLILVYAPTEFSAFRLQLSAAGPPDGEPTVVTGFVQANFTIGAHPAHAY